MGNTEYFTILFCIFIAPLAAAAYYANKHDPEYWSPDSLRIQRIEEKLDRIEKKLDERN